MRWRRQKDAAVEVIRFAPCGHRAFLSCGTTTESAACGNDGTSQPKKTVATNAPASWATMNAGASTGLMPDKVLLAERARVTAGFANDVEAVNQYAAMM